MPILKSYKVTAGFISELTRATGQAGWLAFQSPGVEFHGPCSISVDSGGVLAVDFAQQRADFIAPNLMGQTNPDPGVLAADADVITATVSSVSDWMLLATPETKAGYCASLWIHEQLSGSSRSAIKTALGL